MRITRKASYMKNAKSRLNKIAVAIKTTVKNFFVKVNPGP